MYSGACYICLTRPNGMAHAVVDESEGPVSDPSPSSRDKAPSGERGGLVLPTFRLDGICHSPKTLAKQDDGRWLDMAISPED